MCPTCDTSAVRHKIVSGGPCKLSGMTSPYRSGGTLLSVRISPELAAKVDLAAAVDGRSRSEATRIALEAYVAAVAADKDAAAAGARNEDEPAVPGRARHIPEPVQEAHGAPGP